MDEGGRTSVGPYEILFALAAGGIGSVDVAVYNGPSDFQRLVVLKRPHRHLLNDEIRAMFRDEARLASSIRHPNVVAVTDVVEHDHEVLLVMDYVEGTSLAALVREAPDRRLPPAAVSRMLADALTGLHASHEATDLHGKKLGIVHRDVSPQNLLVGIEGVTRVLDFGIARAAQRTTETEPGYVKGKFAYMSPEQIGSLPVDRRSDVFSAGIVLFEAMTGTRLFDGDSDAAIMRALLDLRVPSAVQRRADLPRALDDLLRISLAREPADRFETAEAFARALETAVPPCAHREVGDLVGRLSEEALSKRARQLKAALERSRAGAIVPSRPTRAPTAITPAAASSLSSASPSDTPVRGAARRTLLLAVVGVIAVATVGVASTRLRAARPSAIEPPPPTGPVASNEPPALPSKRVDVPPVPPPPVTSEVRARRVIAPPAAPRLPPPSQAPSSHVAAPAQPVDSGWQLKQNPYANDP